MKTTGDLNPADYNPRKISQESLDSLGKALDELGDLSGIVKNIRTGNLVTAHQRIKCMPKDTEIHITDRYDPPTAKGTVAEGYIVFAGEKHKYREVDWPMEKEKLANLAANNQGGWNDDAKLAAMLAELQLTPDIDLSLTGLSDGLLDKLLDDMAPEEPKVKEWDLSAADIPFWAVVRCPIDKADKVKAALSVLGEDVIVESSL
jgi:hypothetical protein